MTGRKTAPPKRQTLGEEPNIREERESNGPHAKRADWRESTKQGEKPNDGAEEKVPSRNGEDKAAHEESGNQTEGKNEPRRGDTRTNDSPQEKEQRNFFCPRKHRKVSNLPPLSLPEISESKQHVLKPLVRVTPFSGYGERNPLHKQKEHPTRQEDGTDLQTDCWGMGPFQLWERGILQVEICTQEQVRIMMEKRDDGTPEMEAR